MFSEGNKLPSILKGPVGALDSTLLPSNKQLGNLESQLAVKVSDFDKAAADLSSTERNPGLAECVASLIWKQAQSARSRLCKVESPCSAVKAARAPLESSFQTLTIFKSASRCGVEQLVRQIENLKGEVTRRRQNYDGKVMDLIFCMMVWKCVLKVHFHKSQSFVAC